MRFKILLIAVIGVLFYSAAMAQQDSLAQCGFSRLNFEAMYRWFSPAVGTLRKTTALRHSPSGKARVLQLLPANTRVKMVSDAPSRTPWYQVIDPATGKLGWVTTDAVEVVDGVSVDSTTISPDWDGPLRRVGALTATGKVPETAQLRIVNQYAVPLTVLVSGNTYTVPAAVDAKARARTLPVKSGPQGYVIIVPDVAEIVDVFFGYADIQPASLYEYQVEIMSRE